MLFICIGVFTYLGFHLTEQKPAQKIASEKNEKTQADEKVKSKPVKEPEKEVKQVEVVKPAPVQQAPKEVSEIIEDAQPKVFTIFSDYGQGSGFLMNEFGDVLTNAHVVEGSTLVTVRSNDGTELAGNVIGYSNEIDIAVIRVTELAGKVPLSLETLNQSELGDEVIALGSPKGYENTATLGNISGVDRTFVIEPHTYDGIYQISAPIAPGSSGGPLLDKKTEKVIAINSARDNQEATIGFSIPLFKVIDVINSWVNSPMSEQEIAELYYNSEGLYFYQDLYDNEYYFDGGDYSDEFEDYDYYEVPYDEYSDDQWEESYEDVPADDYSEEYDYEYWEENEDAEELEQEEYPEEEPYIEDESVDESVEEFEEEGEDTETEDEGSDTGDELEVPIEEPIEEDPDGVSGSSDGE